METFLMILLGLIALVVALMLATGIAVIGWLSLRKIVLKLFTVDINRITRY